MLVAGTNSLWTNSQLYVGNAGSGNTLTVADGGTVAAMSISIAQNAGSSGTLNIGRFGTNDTAGTIIAPTIAFGVGTGAINFNQSDSTIISAAISGNGSVNQLGVGTTTLSGSNTYSGGTTISGGAVSVSADANLGAVPFLPTAGNVTLNGGKLIASSSFVLGFTRGFALGTSGGTIEVADGQSVSYGGIAAGSGALSKSGAGSLTLSGANTYSGATTVSAGTLELANASGSALGSTVSVNVASGATLLISQSNQVNNSTTTVTLSGGTITRGSGVSEVFGNLNLTQASFLDFGIGTAGNLTFGTYQNNTTPSALLTVNNFLPGNTLAFGSDLTSTINNTSLFQFSGGFTSAWNDGNSTFTITAIPEPSTYVAALGLLALMLWPLRRRLRGKVS